MSAGKGDKNTRDYDRQKYWNSKLWDNIDKAKLDKDGVKIIDEVKR